MSETDSWASQWSKAQQQFVNAWSDMATPGTRSSPDQADLWAQSFEVWRNACGAQAQPDVQQAMDKCFDMGKEYFSMAEQISKGLSAGQQPLDAINQWMEQLKQSLQQFGAAPGFGGTGFGGTGFGGTGFDGSGVNDFMKQWFSPSQSWQQMAATMTPMNQAAWQMPGMNTSAFNMGEAIDPMGKILSSPGIGYFREPQEKQQKGIQLALEYNEANQAFNQAFLRTATESIQGFQARLMKLDPASAPRSLRELYDLWVEISEEHYAEFAMSEEYQTLYGDMVNRLMIMKKHYSEITDDMLLSMNLPNTREVDTMQERLQQLRRENIKLKTEVGEIKTMLLELTASKAVKSPPVKASAKAAAPAAAAKVAPKAPLKASAKKAPARKAAVKKPAAKKATTGKQSTVTKARKGA